MISVIYMVLFTLTGEIRFVTDQRTFDTIAECNLYAEGVRADQQQKVEEGISVPHISRHICVVWGEDI